MVKKSETKATVTKAKAKQEELPTITVSDRRIAEIEDLGDALIDAEDKASAAREKVKEANENLVACMKKRERTFYSRSTWGSVILSESSVKAKAKHTTATTGGSDSEDAE